MYRSWQKRWRRRGRRAGLRSFLFIFFSFGLAAVFFACRSLLQGINRQDYSEQLILFALWEPWHGRGGKLIKFAVGTKRSIPSCCIVGIARTSACAAATVLSSKIDFLLPGDREFFFSLRFQAPPCIIDMIDFIRTLQDESLSSRIYAQTCAKAGKCFYTWLDDWFQALVSAAAERPRA